MQFDYADGLGYLIHPQNVARYEDGVVRILDRRNYPMKVDFVECREYQEVVQAIRNMVTQSMGPWLASAYGMVLAARTAGTMKPEGGMEYLSRAADELGRARPTTSAFQVRHMQQILAVALQAIKSGSDVERLTLDFVYTRLKERYEEDQKIGSFAAGLFPEKVKLLTHCFAETLLGYTLLEARKAGKAVSLICPETRPFLQGARLTASMAREMDIPVTVVTDNMPAFMMSQGMIDVFACAADVVTLDGYAVNKVGTYQLAIAAHYHKIPCYILRNPSISEPDINEVQIEMRNPEESLMALGTRIVKEGVKGFYPAFDITPPTLISGVVTSSGVFSAFDLKNHFQANGA
ncbi:MAG: s-methyl-5-thioribose-1-phosphate isomerase [Leptolinea sp.]|jgi:methylthioribose-1-phosphate isomerase|nr:s-methyl-5-thioribose-1-phosphate isomerase [Leptolinea sp.]